MRLEQGSMQNPTVVQPGVEASGAEAQGQVISEVSGVFGEPDPNEDDSPTQGAPDAQAGVVEAPGTAEADDSQTQGAPGAQAGGVEGSEIADADGSTSQEKPDAEDKGASGDSTAGVEGEKDEKRRFAGFGKVIAVAGIVFSLAKGFLKDLKRKEAVGSLEKEAVEEREAGRIFQSFASKIQGALDNHADIAKGERRGIFSKWFGKMGEQYRINVAKDNAYREAHGMETVSGAQRTERWLALSALTLASWGIDVITPDLTGVGLSDIAIDQFVIETRRKLYEEWTGDTMEPMAIQIAEQALNFIPGVRMFNLMLGPLWEAMIQTPRIGSRLQRFEEYIDGSAAMIMIRDFLKTAWGKTKDVAERDVPIPAVAPVSA